MVEVDGVGARDRRVDDRDTVDFRGHVARATVVVVVATILLLFVAPCRLILLHLSDAIVLVDRLMLDHRMPTVGRQEVAADVALRGRQHRGPLVRRRGVEGAHGLRQQVLQGIALLHDERAYVAAALLGAAREQAAVGCLEHLECHAPDILVTLFAALIFINLEAIKAGSADVLAEGVGKLVVGVCRAIILHAGGGQRHGFRAVRGHKRAGGGEEARRAGERHDASDSCEVQRHPVPGRRALRNAVELVGAAWRVAQHAHLAQGRRIGAVDAVIVFKTLPGPRNAAVAVALRLSD
mmetsp:Transcript_16055/g.55866  ORF Transcript_16055/g.55866 Transcript_16055/m.55866 type:complete len:295 (-) Transcript_16055:91-975(-)